MPTSVKKTLLVCTTVLCLTQAISQQSELPKTVYQAMLEYRLQHSSAATTLKNDAAIAENTYRQQLIGSYIVADFGTGTMNFKFTDNKLDYSLTPYFKIVFPSFSSASVNISVPLSKNSVGSGQGFDIGLGLDLYSKSIARQKLARKTAKSSMTEASEKFKYVEASVENELLTEVKNICASYVEYTARLQDTVTADIEFQKMKLEGYQPTSTKYKATELKKISSETQAKTAYYLFAGKFKTFIAHSGIKLELDDNEEVFRTQADNFFSALASSIPDTAVLPTENLAMESAKAYQQITEAYRNTVEQHSIDKSLCTISALANFSQIKQKSELPLASEETTEKKSFSTGLSVQLPGCNVYSGISIDIDKKEKPSLELSVAINPLDIYYKVLSIENINLQCDIDEITFNNNIEKCKTAVNDVKSQAENLTLLKDASKYEYEIYKQNASDIKQLFSTGYTTALDNNRAQLDYMQALIKYAQAKADVLMFNNQLIQDYTLTGTESTNTQTE